MFNLHSKIGFGKIGIHMFNLYPKIGFDEIGFGGIGFSKTGFGKIGGHHIQPCTRSKIERRGLMYLWPKLRCIMHSFANLIPASGLPPQISKFQDTKNP
jgi:hypothetical protein